MLGCPVSLAVWQWFAATWSAVAQQPAPPLHADLLLADDRRGPWQPAAQCDSLWQRLRLLVITQLWVAYCRSRSQPGKPTSPAHIAARVISAARTEMRCNWTIWPTPLGHCLCHPFHSLRSSLFADPVSQAVRCTTLYLGHFLTGGCT